VATSVSTVPVSRPVMVTSWISALPVKPNSLMWAEPLVPL
jgi:hypothetical protein